MKIKKIIGYIFIIIAIFLTVAIIGQIQRVIESIFGIFKIFNGELESYHLGKIIGSFIYWFLHFSIIIFLFFLGKRFIKKT